MYCGYVCLCAAETGDEVVLQFQLSKVGGHRLQLTVMDCERLYRVVSLTALGTVDPERLHTLFNTQTVDGRLHKAGFDLCIRTLVPGQALSPVDKQYVKCDCCVLWLPFPPPPALPASCRNVLRCA